MVQQHARDNKLTMGQLYGTTTCKGQQTNIGTTPWYLESSTPSMQLYNKHARGKNQEMGH